MLLFARGGGDVKHANKNSYMSHARCGYELCACII